MKFPIQEKFKLSDGFIEKYKEIKPKFGFGGLGEFVFFRTYSRLKEDGKNEAWFENPLPTPPDIQTKPYFFAKKRNFHQLDPAHLPFLSSMHIELRYI